MTVVFSKTVPGRKLELLHIIDIGISNKILFFVREFLNSLDFSRFSSAAVRRDKKHPIIGEPIIPKPGAF